MSLSRLAIRQKLFVIVGLFILPIGLLVGLFLQREAARKLPAGMEGAAPVKRLGVIGAGVMGAGIVQLAALSGCEAVEPGSGSSSTR